MKQQIRMRLLIAAITIAAVPATLLAQEDHKEKEVTKDKEIQQIIITRRGNKEEKTIIEIKGDKVTVNGKEGEDAKDVTVNIRDIRSPKMKYFNSDGSGNVFMNPDDQAMHLFSEDEHRAMLGVVTDGAEKGAEIQSVNKGSGAEKAGLKKGDIITEIDGKKVEDPEVVTQVVHAHKPGDKINITVLRDGKEQKLTAELGKWKGIRMNSMTIPRVFNGDGMEAPMAPMTPNAPMTMQWGDQDFNFSFNDRPRLGLSVQDLEEGPGVKVLNVDDESAAEKAGIREDDVIVSIDGKDIKSTDDVKRIIHESRDKTSFTFRINRGGKTQDIVVKMPRKVKTADL